MNIKCDFCESTFYSLVDFKIHLTKDHREIKNKSEIYKLKASTWNVHEAIKEKNYEKREKLVTFNRNIKEIRKRIKAKRHYTSVRSSEVDNPQVNLKQEGRSSKKTNPKKNPKSVKNKRKKNKRKSIRVIYTAFESNRNRH